MARSWPQSVTFAITLFCGALTVVTAYLPGVGPVKYKQGQDIKLFVNELTSTRTQIPFDYYSLPFCHGKVKVKLESLGEYLEGDRMENSVYQLRIREPTYCEVACVRTLQNKEAWHFRSAIKDEYRVHMTLDNLPAALEVTAPSGGLDAGEQQQPQAYFVRGFPVGFVGTEGQHYLYNHIRITVGINPREEGMYNVVGFLVEPFSVNHQMTEGEKPATCGKDGYGKDDPLNYLSVDGAGPVVFTYDVLWEETNMPWTQRWDIYLSGSPGDQVHWFSITNSSLIVLFLTVLVAMILVRALRKDIQKYNTEQDIVEAKEESGWKLVHGDVFRPPTEMPMLFTVCVGTGVQLLATVFLMLLFSVMGLLSPAYRGSLLTACILLFVLMGSLAGYHAARIHRMFRGTSWLKTTLATAGTYPAFCTVIFLVLNGGLFAKGSTGAVPFTTLLQLLALWVLVQAPLVFAGSYLGFKREPPEQPVRTNQIPRMIPQQPWYINPWVAVPFSGVLPFGAASVEIFFIFTSVWLHQIYYIFGFLLLVLVILMATCAEISLVLCYFQLCAEDYRWWWRSLLWSGSCAGYMFLYAAWYYFVQLEMVGFLPAMLYFGYSLLLAVSFFLLTGAVGFFACYWFIAKIYGSVKVD